MLSYHVRVKYARGEQEIAQFISQTDAEDFIEMKAQKDAMLRVTTVYALYRGTELIKTIDSQQVGSVSSTSQGQGSQQKSSSQTFNPTPAALATTLRPSGMPLSSFKTSDKNNEDDRKK